MSELCPICNNEFATVTLTTASATVKVGRSCSRILEALLVLSGATDVRRRPVLQVVE